MNRFEWVNPGSLDDAVAALGDGKKAALKAGGVDLLDQMKEGTFAPARLVNLKALPRLDHVNVGVGGLQIGPLATLHELATHAELGARYAALLQAAGSAATPQIRRVATLGGNLCQRPRCWYFRAAEFVCLKKGGTTCFAKKGDNRYHAIFGGGPSYIVHPSTMATALTAFGASVKLHGKRGEREVPLDRFFTLPDVDVARENLLDGREAIVEIVVPVAHDETQSAYRVVKERQVYDWPLVEAAVVLTKKGKNIERASVVLGAVAPIPWRAHAAEKLLAGASLSRGQIEKAAEAATAGAHPLSHNGYKVALVKSVVEEALLAAGGLA